MGKQLHLWFIRIMYPVRVGSLNCSVCGRAGRGKFRCVMNGCCAVLGPVCSCTAGVRVAEAEGCGVEATPPAALLLDSLGPSPLVGK